jgi:hypothetical protein
VQLLPSIPRLAHRALSVASEGRRDGGLDSELLTQLIREQRRTRSALWALVVLTAGAIGLQVWYWMH